MKICESWERETNKPKHGNCNRERKNILFKCMNTFFQTPTIPYKKVSFVGGLLVHFYIPADFPRRDHNRTRRPDNVPDECIGDTYKRIVGYPALGLKLGRPTSKLKGLSTSPSRSLLCTFYVMKYARLVYMS